MKIQLKMDVPAEHYRAALDVMTDSDLLRVTTAFRTILAHLIKEGEEHGKDPLWAYFHPITGLFAYRIAFLSGVPVGRTPKDPLDELLTEVHVALADLKAMEEAQAWA